MLFRSNPHNASVAEAAVREVQNAAPSMGLQIQILNASTIDEIDAAFATFARERPDALFVAGDALFVSRRGQLATLTARDRIPAAYGIREFVEAGGLMSYGTDILEMFRQVGVYSGKVLKGAKPAETPGGSVNQIRVRYQRRDCQSAWPYYSCGRVLYRRPGDRISGNVRYWPKADMAECAAHVRFWG